MRGLVRFVWLVAMVLLMNTVAMKPKPAKAFQMPMPGFSFQFTYNDSKIDVSGYDTVRVYRPRCEVPADLPVPEQFGENPKHPGDVILNLNKEKERKYIAWIRRNCEYLGYLTSTTGVVSGFPYGCLAINEVSFTRNFGITGIGCSLNSGYSLLAALNTGDGYLTGLVPCQLRVGPKSVLLHGVDHSSRHQVHAFVFSIANKKNRANQGFGWQFAVFKNETRKGIRYDVRNLTYEHLVGMCQGLVTSKTADPADGFSPEELEGGGDNGKQAAPEKDDREPVQRHIESRGEDDDSGDVVDAKHQSSGAKRQHQRKHREDHERAPKQERRHRDHDKKGRGNHPQDEPEPVPGGDDDDNRDAQESTRTPPATGLKEHNAPRVAAEASAPAAPVARATPIASQPTPPPVIDTPGATQEEREVEIDPIHGTESPCLESKLVQIYAIDGSQPQLVKEVTIQGPSVQRVVKKDVLYTVVCKEPGETMLVRPMDGDVKVRIPGVPYEVPARKPDSKGELAFTLVQYEEKIKATIEGFLPESGDDQAPLILQFVTQNGDIAIPLENGTPAPHGGKLADALRSFSGLPKARVVNGVTHLYDERYFLVPTGVKTLEACRWGDGNGAGGQTDYWIDLSGRDFEIPVTNGEIDLKVRRNKTPVEER